jgi:hypothetical protein
VGAVELDASASHRFGNVDKPIEVLWLIILALQT